MIGGKRVTPELLFEWRDMQSATTEDRRRITEQALSQLSAILSVCSDDSLAGVVTRLGDAFEAILSEYRMRPSIKNLLDESFVTHSEPQRMTIAELNTLCSASPDWKGISSGYSPHEIAQVKEKRTPLWIRLSPAMCSGFRCEMTVKVRKLTHRFGFSRITGLQVIPR